MDPGITTDPRALLVFLYCTLILERERYRERYTHINLQWQNYHKYPLLVAGEDMLDEGPARPDQHNCEEQQTSLASGLPFNHHYFIEFVAVGIT